MKDIIFSSTAGCIKDSGTAKGRGVFAVRDVAIGDVVEVCPVVIVKAKWDEMPEAVQRIVFDWGYLTKSTAASCIALGWGSMYNHSNPANLRYVAVPDELCMHFIAARDIREGEEFTVNYNETGGDIHSTEDAWFEDTGITPI